MDKAFVNLPCNVVQVDEIWSFVGAKQKNVRPENGAHGDIWTWVAIDAETKLIPCYAVATRKRP